MANPCPHTDVTADAYVSGLLSEEERSAFEEHFFACGTCFAAVQRLQDVQSILTGSETAARPAPSVVPFEPPGRSRRFGRASAWAMLAAASLVVLTGVGVWELRRFEAPSSIADTSSGPAVTPQRQTGSTPGVDPASPPPPPPATADPLAPLAVVVAPLYLPMTTRAAQDDDTRAFEAAMTAYRAGRYRPAVQQLEALAKRSPRFAPAQFFLGVSQLMIGEERAARVSLQRCIALAAPAYSDEAHFYLAKAALRLGELSVAERELQATVARDAGPAGEAARLLTALRALR